MNKKLKYFLIASFILLFLIVGWFFRALNTSSERHNKDNYKCANIAYVTDMPLITLDAYFEIEVIQLRIGLIRNNKKIRDTVIDNNNNKYSVMFNIPFNEFKKTDIILVETKNKSYKISEFNYYNDGHWGALGYLGGKCELDYKYEIIEND